MGESRSPLLYEASALHSLVESVREFCSQHREQYSYLDASDDFLIYLGDVCRQTQSGLQELIHVESPPRVDVDPQSLHAKLFFIKAFWREIHEYVKPAADAHTLNLPVSLIETIQARLRAITGLREARIVILVSPELNYLQYRVHHLGQLAERLAIVVPSVRAFPKGLAFIGIPYSQGPWFFSNVLIAHELGHFVLDELGLREQLEEHVDREWSRTFGAQRSSEAAQICREWLRSWSEEIFCDLFALRLLGPAFSFASLQLFALLGVLDPEAALDFDVSHPAPACRFKEHVEQLKVLGWWQEIEQLNLDAVSTLITLAGRTDSEYTFAKENDSGVSSKALASFRSICSAIRTMVLDRFGSDPSDVRDFSDHRAPIRSCLSVGVVPSASARSLPTPIAMVNAGYCFYLESFPELLANVKDIDAQKVQDRSAMSRRLELWILKALDDYTMLANQGES